MRAYTCIYPYICQNSLRLCHSALQLLDIGSATLMLNMVEICEVGKALVVGLEDGCCLNSLNAISSKIWGHLVEDKGRNTLVLIVGTHSNQ